MPKVQAVAQKPPGYSSYSSAHLIKRKQSAGRKSAAAERYSFDPQINRHEVLIEWDQLCIFPSQLIREQFAKLLQLCSDTHKDELVILNIAPSFRVGQDGLDEVLAIQNQIVLALRIVAASFQQSQPETRLSLRRGEFDVRVYLGSTYPRDHVHADER